jgi:hypothetical protein
MSNPAQSIKEYARENNETHEIMLSFVKTLGDAVLDLSRRLKKLEEDVAWMTHVHNDVD